MKKSSILTMDLRMRIAMAEIDIFSVNSLVGLVIKTHWTVFPRKASGTGGLRIRRPFMARRRTLFLNSSRCEKRALVVAFQRRADTVSLVVIHVSGRHSFEASALNLASFGDEKRK